MTKVQDFRLNESYFKTLIDKCFKKYRSDPFEYTNSVTGIVGIYIDDKTFEIRNEQKSIRYFDSVDDIAVWNFKEVNANDINVIKLSKINNIGFYLATGKALFLMKYFFSYE